MLHLAAPRFGTAWIAYCTSTMVSLVTFVNQAKEDALQKMHRIDSYLDNGGVPVELRLRARSCSASSVGTCPCPPSLPPPNSYSFSLFLANRVYLQKVLLDKKLELHAHELLRDLSFPLRAEAALHRCLKLIMSPNFINLLVKEGGEVRSSWTGLFPRVGFTSHTPHMT